MLGGPSGLSPLLTGRGNVSLLPLGPLQDRFYGKGTSVQEGMCPGPGLFDSGINSSSVSFKESLPTIIPRQSAPSSLQDHSIDPVQLQPGHCSSSLVPSRGQTLRDTEIKLQINTGIAMDTAPPPPCCSSPPMCTPGSWGIYNPWNWGNVHLQESTRCCQPRLLCRAGGSRAQARPAGISPLPKGGIPFPERGSCCSCLGRIRCRSSSFRVDFQPQAATAPAELRCSSSQTCGREGEKNKRSKPSKVPASLGGYKCSLWRPRDAD